MQIKLSSILFLGNSPLSLSDTSEKQNESNVNTEVLRLTVDLCNNSAFSQDALFLKFLCPVTWPFTCSYYITQLK